MDNINNSHDLQVRCNWKNCFITFRSLDQLSIHLNTIHCLTSTGGQFYCQWKGCNRSDRGFNARYKLLVHIRTHTKEKPHQCSICSKGFSRAENLKIHFRSHSGQKPYVCPIPECKKSYSNSSDCFKHRRTHFVDKPYSCKVVGCLKKYTDPSSLRKHMKSQHFSNINIPLDLSIKKNHICV